MDARSLVLSLQGLSRILRASAHFAVRGEYAENPRNQHVQVFLGAPQAGCLGFELVALAAPLQPLVDHIDAKTLWKTAHALTQAILFRNGKPSVAEKAIEIHG